MSDQQHRETPIWDLPTRLFHWALVVLVGTNLFLVEPRGGIATVIHMTFGYGVTGLLLFRLVWGFVGSPRSRFADFVHPWAAVKDYAAKLRRFSPPRSVGHNPLGGWMIVAMLVVLAALVATGVFASGRHAAGAFATLVPVDVTAIAGDAHEFLGNLMIALVIVHLVGVAVDWLLTRENLVKAMVNGRKPLPAAVSIQERPLAGGARAALVGVVCLGIVVGLITATDFTLNRATLQQGAPVNETSLEQQPG
ncbi:MAG: cytochrome b/b6 domain-containing protein [Dongiaceae bacterium]